MSLGTSDPNEVLQQATELNLAKSKFNSIFNNREFLKLVVSIMALTFGALFYALILPALPVSGVVYSILQVAGIGTIVTGSIATIFNGVGAAIEAGNNREATSVSSSIHATKMYESLLGALEPIVENLIDTFGSDNIRENEINVKNITLALIEKNIKNFNTENGMVPNIQKTTQEVIKQAKEQISKQINGVINSRKDIDSMLNSFRSQFSSALEDLSDPSSKEQGKKALQNLKSRMHATILLNSSNGKVKASNSLSKKQSMNQDDIESLTSMTQHIDSELKTA